MMNSVNVHPDRHLRGLRAVAALLLALCATPAHALGLLVPAYQYPTTGTLWADCAQAAARVPLVAVLDPDSGPGPVADLNYTAAVGAVRANGGRVIAYIATFDASKAPDSVLAEAGRYLSQYLIDGFFLDLMSNAADPVKQAYYANVGARLRALRPGALIVGNPGTQTLPEYMAGVDIVCNHENFGEAYFGFEPSAWVAGFSPSRFVHLVHSLSTADSMLAAVQRASTRRAQWVFVTQDTMPNPWDLTPSYWNALVDAVAATQIAGVADPAPRALRATPNPTRGAVTFAGLPASVAAVRVVDAQGRQQRVVPARSGTALWDGRDESGRSVAPGLYFAIVSGREARRVARVVVVD